MCTLQDRLSEAGVGTSVGVLGEEVHRTRKVNGVQASKATGGGGMNGGTTGDAIV